MGHPLHQQSWRGGEKNREEMAMGGTEKGDASPSKFSDPGKGDKLPLGWRSTKHWGKKRKPSLVGERNLCLVGGGGKGTLQTRKDT